MKKKKQVVEAVDPKVIIGDEAHRCRLCADGAIGKQLIEVTDAVRQKRYSCITHVAFYGRDRTDVNRKYLPGTETKKAPPLAEDPPDDEGPKISMRDFRG